MNREQNGQAGPSGTVLDPTMSLVGRLEDLSLGEILQIVSLSKRSGLLRIEAPNGRSSLYIRAGKVIYVSTSEENESVLHLLVENGSIDPGELDFFSEKLESVGSSPEFISLLEERTGIDHEGFQEVLKNRVENLTYSLFNWEEGTFSFQLVDDEAKHPLLSKVAPFFLDEGIGAQFLVMEGARRKDESLRVAPPVEHREEVPGEYPDGALSEEWEQEFEQHLTGSEDKNREAEAKEGLEREIEEFIVPENLPELPREVSNRVVAVGLQPPFIVELTGGFVRAGIELLVHENGADALTVVQESRQESINPYLLVDLEAAGITDGRVLGGLETVSTMWDFGFHLPVGLVCRRDLDEKLESKLRTVTGLTIFPAAQKPDKNSVREILETVTNLVSPHPAPTGETGGVLSKDVADRGAEADGPIEPSGVLGPDASLDEGNTPKSEEYYDIQMEFSDELSEIDLPLQGWDEGQAANQEISSDPHMARLSSYVNELNRQDISGEITLLALRFASDFVNRAVLFLLRKEDIKGLGQFGVDLGEGLDPDTVVRSLNLPLEERSIFKQVAQHRQSYKGPPTGSDLEKALFKSLGGGVPEEIFIGPIVSMGKVAVLLYGDDYPMGKGLEPTHTLDIFLSHVGLALDRAFLEMKLKSQRS